MRELSWWMALTADPLTPRKWGLASVQVSPAAQGECWVCGRAGCAARRIACGPKVVPSVRLAALQWTRGFKGQARSCSKPSEAVRFFG